jgi:hypothetical protein
MVTKSEMGNALRILRAALEHGGIRVNGFVECFAQVFPIVLDDKWEIHGVNGIDDRMSFHASVDDGKTVILFAVKDEPSQKGLNAFLETVVPMINLHPKRKVPYQIADATFVVGLTHYVPGLREPKPA